MSAERYEALLQNLGPDPFDQIGNDNAAGGGENDDVLHEFVDEDIEVDEGADDDGGDAIGSDNDAPDNGGHAGGGAGDIDAIGDDDVIAADDDGIGGGGAPWLDYDWPSEIEGCRVTYEHFDRGGRTYRRLVIHCRTPGHFGCRKYRNVGPAQCAHLGVREPIAYLATWFLSHQLYTTAAAHKEYRPTLAEQREWLEANP